MRSKKAGRPELPPEKRRSGRLGMRTYTDVQEKAKRVGTAAVEAAIRNIDNVPQPWETRTDFRLGRYCDTSDAMKAMQDEIDAWRNSCSTTSAPLLWPVSPGWYWAFGRIAGMREATLMSARALHEGDRLIVYIGEATTHRLSSPDMELPLQFKPATLPKF